MVLLPSYRAPWQHHDPHLAAGKGLEYEAEVTSSVSNKVAHRVYFRRILMIKLQVTVNVGKAISNRAESPLQITLAQSIARGEKVRQSEDAILRKVIALDGFHTAESG